MSVQRLISVRIQNLINKRPVFLIFFFVAVDVIDCWLDYLSGLHCVLVGRLEVQVVQVFFDLLLQLVQATHRLLELLRLCLLESILNLRVLLTGVKPLSGNRVGVFKGLGSILLAGAGLFSSLLG